MQTDTALLVAFLFSCSIYLILDTSFVKVLFGFVVLSNATNILLLAMSGSPDGKDAPLILPGTGPHVDPLPQALILTAIVIGFGVTAYLVMLLYRMFLDQKTTHVGRMYDEPAPEVEDE